jgi:signal transduction histidine kinase
MKVNSSAFQPGFAMLHQNGHVPAVLTLITTDCPKWLPEVSTQLGKANYQATIANSTDDAWHIIRAQQPDALLVAGNQAENLSMFQAIRDELPPEEQPLLVLLTDQLNHNILPLTADIIAPPNPIDYLERQLRTLIELRAKNAKLKADNDRLQREVEIEKQSSGGINLLRNSIVRNVAHELRTPLLQVKAAVGLLAEDMGDSTTLIGLAQRATTRLEGVVQSITMLNELVNETYENRAFEAVQLKEVVDSAIRNLRRSWEHKDHVDRIKVQIPTRLSPVWGEKHRLVIVMQLLIDNALKFSEDEVEVSAKRVDKDVIISVRDSGIGIPNDKIQHIFDTFYQVDNSSTRPYGGMGIGLAIVRFILERHSTVIEVNTQVGKGSTFSFKLPTANLKQTV